MLMTRGGTHDTTLTAGRVHSRSREMHESPHALLNSSVRPHLGPAQSARLARLACA